MKRLRIILISLWILSCGPLIINAYANNLVIENIALTDKDTDTNTYDIKFDIAWDNSWFIDGAPGSAANWDAAWVFAKFSKSTDSGATWSNWAHCTLLNTGYTASGGSQMSFGVTGSVYIGVFVFRSTAGSGSVDWNNVEVRWAYGVDGVEDTDIVRIKVFGIEMVYVPEGSFYVGDGYSSNGRFEAGVTGEPFQITSEDALTLGGGGAGSLGNNDAAGMAVSDDFNDTTTQTLPADFPKGYNAFYIMKYEISQGQYCNFLNTLTSTQIGNRTWNYYGTDRSFIKLASDGKYGCDADNDAGDWGLADWFLMNEPNDGQWIACNFLNGADLCAFADWAGLRPFTELELEKACRGAGQTPVINEYAWGSATTQASASSLIDGGTISEIPNQGSCNFSYLGPFRVGCFADSTSTREDSGAGYYGALDLTASLWECPVTVGNSTGRGFTGNHGDGVLSSLGYANEANWPEEDDSLGLGRRCGSWGFTSIFGQVSNRYLAALKNSSRLDFNGARVARTAP